MLLADPSLQSVIEVKFSDIDSVEGKASNNQKERLDELFKSYYAAKVSCFLEVYLFINLH